MKCVMDACAFDSSLVAVVSPYHLTTREAPALAALLFADRVVTIRPTPLGGESRSEVCRAMDLAPWSAAAGFMALEFGVVAAVL